MAEDLGKSEANGRFLPGNRFWTVRSRAGRFPKFATVEALEAACFEYFDWAHDNPLQEAKAFSYEGVVTIAALPKMRALTIGGLCIFIDLVIDAWKAQAQRGPEWADLVSRVEAIIRTQKFEGAAADLLNAAIIARDLGLADRSEVTGRDGGPIETKELSDLEVARRIAFLLTDSKP